MAVMIFLLFDGIICISNNLPPPHRDFIFLEVMMFILVIIWNNVEGFL